MNHKNAKTKCLNISADISYKYQELIARRTSIESN